MTDWSKAAHPFHSRPLIGKLKFVLAKVQSQWARLPEAERTERKRLRLLNKELEFYHLYADNWPDFVTFVRNPPVSSKVLSGLLRHARWQEKACDPYRYESRRARPNTDNRWAFVVEEIRLAAYYGIPFRLLEMRWRFGAEIEETDIGYRDHVINEHANTRARLAAIRAQGRLVEFAKQNGITIPLRKSLMVNDAKTEEKG